MNRPVLVVNTGDDAGADISMAEAIEALAAKLIAMRPTVVLVAYELAPAPAPSTAASGKFGYFTIPPAGVLARGFVHQLHDMIYPPEAEE